jgi:hypothetical protein
MGKTGSVFPAANVQLLALAMETYARHPDVAYNHGQNARQQLEQYHVSAATENTVAAVLSIPASNRNFRNKFNSLLASPGKENAI